MVLATVSSVSESRRAGASAGAVSSLAGTREALLLSAQEEAGQKTAAASETGLIRGLTANTAEAGRVAGACVMLEGSGPRDQGGFST